MLRTYGRQLTSAKRLERFRRAMLGERARDDISRAARRRELVHKVATEIIENLIVNGSENPVILEIMRDLERTVGGRVFFEYPLDLGEVIILKESPSGATEVTGEERSRIMRTLWELTLARVDATML
jgi:transposase